MLQEKRIAVVIPAYNEEKNISRVIETLPAYVDHIVVVDDCSQDSTFDCVQEHALHQPQRVVALRNATNQGAGASMGTGYTWCRDHDVDIAVSMDGDGQMDPEDLPALLQPLLDGRADYAKGNRLFTGDAWRQIPKVRYLGNSAMSMLTKIASGYWHVADSQSGYRAINARALQAIDWSQMYKRYGYPNDVLVRLNVYNFRVQDVPIRPVYHKNGKSGIRPIRMIPRLSWLLLKLFLWRMKEKYIIRDFHPLIFFYLMAFSLLALSLPLTGRLFYLWWLNDRIPPINALALMFTVIAGFQSLFFAMWFDMEHGKNMGGR